MEKKIGKLIIEILINRFHSVRIWCLPQLQFFCSLVRFILFIFLTFFSQCEVHIRFCAPFSMKIHFTWFSFSNESNLSSVFSTFRSWICSFFFVSSFILLKNFFTHSNIICWYRARTSFDLALISSFGKLVKEKMCFSFHLIVFSLYAKFHCMARKKKMKQTKK